MMSALACRSSRTAALAMLLLLVLAQTPSVSCVRTWAAAQTEQEFDKELSDQEELLSNKINTGREPVFCQDNSLQSPVDIQGDIVLKNFTVTESWDYSYKTFITKVSDHVFRLDGTFGYIGFNSIKYTVMYAIFRAPSEHRIEGERTPMELNIVCKSTNGEHVTLSIMFKVVDEPNYFMNIIGFGQGILSKLNNEDALNIQRHEIKDLAMTLKPFLLNDGSWIMYEGHDVNPPCSNTTWLLSIEPVPITLQQLNDFNSNARPDYTMKSIGARTIFRNMLKDTSAQARLVQQQLEAERVKMKQLMDKRKAEEEAMRHETELAFKKRQEELRKLVLEYRANKTTVDFKDPPRVGLEPLVTDNLLKLMFEEQSTFNFLNTPCVNYVKYIPTLDRPYGYVPADGIMSWEIKKFLSENRNAAIPVEELPSPVNTSYVYRPFFYIKKPDCHKNSTIFKLLAKAGAYADNNTNTSVQELVPVIIETSPDFASPERVATAFKMAIPGRTPELQYAVIRRQWIPETNPIILQNLNISNQYFKTYGHNVPEPIDRNLSLIPPPPGAVNSKGKVIRIWPELLAPEDGVLPDDAIFAWSGVNEGDDIVANITAPTSFNTGYRWIVLMYLQCNYTVGSLQRQPLIPVFILARNEFKFEKDNKPDYIPVPQNTEITDDVVKAELITISFMARSSVKSLPNPSILERPVGYDPAKIFIKPLPYRQKQFIRKSSTDPDYFNKTHAKYLNRTDERPDRLNELEREEVTGIIVNPDPVWRNKQAEETKKKEQEIIDRLNYEALREKRLKGIYEDPYRVTNYERYCVRYELEIVLNDRFNFIDKGKESTDFKVCKEYGWRKVEDDNELYQKPNTDGERKKIEDNKEKEKEQEKIKDKAIKHVEDYCRDKLHVVLNNRNGEAVDEHYELCKETINELRKTKVRLFMGRLGPVLEKLRDKIQEGAQKLEEGVSKATKSVGKEVEKVGDLFDKRKYMQPIKAVVSDITDSAKQMAARTKTNYERLGDSLDKSRNAQPLNMTVVGLAKGSSVSVSTSYHKQQGKAKSKASLPSDDGFLTRLAKSAKRLWSRASK